MSGFHDSRDWKRQAHALFEFEASLYAADRESQFGFQAQLSISLRMLGNSGGRVLDIGCASGSAINALRRIASEVVGIDFSPSMLAHAAGRFRSDASVRFSLADAERLPFRDASFDQVICLGVLEYLPQYQRVLAEISRILRPGGRVVFSIPSRISPYYWTLRFADIAVGPIWRRAKRVMGFRPPTGQTPTHRRNLCIPWKFRELLRQSGLAPYHSEYTNFFVFPLDRLWPSANLRLARALERFGRSRLLGWLASQYMVAARRDSPAAHRGD